MTTETNRRWLLASRPQGMATESNFERRDEPRPSVTDGQLLVRTLYLSVDPAMRGWMTEDPDYVAPIPLGSVMPSGGLGQVVESRHDDFRPGDFVSGLLGWQDYHLTDGRGAAPLATFEPVHPLPTYLGTLGGTGLTAYFGMREVARPKEGETVVVSGAAGATGSVAVQIARILQCRVIGIAGGAAKCRWLTKELGLDGAIDYKTEDVGARLNELCPGGVDVYFDNVGGPTLGVLLDRMNRWGRIAVCGMISGYNAGSPQPGPANLFRLITRRIRMEGFLVPDYAPRFKEARRELSAWLATGALRSQEDVREGFENIPATFLDLFRGGNTGKLMVRLADPPTRAG
ncbi:MAG: NADP-dependent oxidoreductase [Acidobacteria bacterium]|nr:NADP-dependent oxidoreductase [Acidobacteriota bacterium]